MFELADQFDNSDLVTQITMLMDMNKIPDDERESVQTLLVTLYDRKTPFEIMVTVCIALYVIQETEDWQNFLTEDNLRLFVNDSVLIMCSEGEFLTNLPWMISGQTGMPYDLLGNLLAFMSEQFIMVFQS